MKKHLSTILFVTVLITGISLLLYPTVSNYWNMQIQSRAVASYKEATGNLTQQDTTALFETAQTYNTLLRQYGIQGFYDPSLIPGYEEALDVTGTGIMGYINIEKLDLELPIYHSTSPDVLQIAAGHLEGTSLPTGGEGNHCVISAHRGLPSAILFSDLDKMEVGDTFTITVLDQLMTYQVDQVLVVDPNQVDALQIEEGKDLCTLMTCTPYGVNTQRLLVRGVRIPNPTPEEATRVILDEARRIPVIGVGVVVSLPCLLAALILLLKFWRKPKER